MFCTNCGAEMRDTAVFCTNCGTPLEKPRAAAASAPASQTGIPSRAAGQAVAPQQANPPYQPPIAPRGCFGSAWDDFFQSPNWLRQVLLMGLIELVPILNFVNLGYVYQWGANAARGMRDALPQKIITGQNFKLGFFILVSTFVYGLAFTLLGNLAVYVWNQGNATLFMILLLVLLVLGILSVMFLNLAFVNVVLMDSPSGGLSFGRIAHAFKVNVGTLFCVSYIPGLVTFGIAFVAGLLCGALSSAVGGAGMMGIFQSNSLEAVLGNYGGAFTLIALIGLVEFWLIYVAMWLGMAIAARGAGYYINRFVPSFVTGAVADRVHMEQAVQDRVEQVRNDAAVQGRGDMGGVSPQGEANQSQPVVLTPIYDAPEPEEPAPVRVERDVPSPVAEETATGRHAKPADDLAGSADTFVGDTIVGDTIVGDTVVGDTYVGDSRVVADAAPGGFDMAGFRDYERSVAEGTSVVVLDKYLDVTESTTVMAKPTLQLERTDGSVCTITDYPASVGKSIECDVCIPDNPLISREHAQILYDDGTFAIEDLGSTNHTTVQGYRIDPHAPTIISDGDVVKLGNEVLTVHIIPAF